MVVVFVDDDGFVGCFYVFNVVIKYWEFIVFMFEVMYW